MTQFVSLNGLALNYVTEGLPGGSPLIFINSLGTDLRIWDDVVSQLASHYRIIRYDKRGHGLSDCPPAPYTIREHASDLAALLDYLDIRRASLVGISVGGMIALDFAAAWPQRVEKLVLCDTAAAIGTADAWNERIRTIREHGMAYLSEAILARWFAPSFAVRAPADYQGYCNMLARMPSEGYVATCEAIRDADLEEEARTVVIPVLAICGAEDISTPPDLVRSLVEILPNASYEEIAGAAHLPCIEQPDALAVHIDSFL
jgi:3-oxoadipate enol-lactonase